MTTTPDYERIVVLIDNVDVANRSVLAQDRTSGIYSATFYEIVDTDRIPNVGESWIAERHSWDSWRLVSRMPSVEENTEISDLNPGDRRISATGTVYIEGEELLFNGAPIEGGGGGGVTDHGALTGLGDDDHTQYHNNARGDARYWQLSTDLATQAELDAVAGAKANTSHTHVATDVTDFDEKARRHSWFWG